MSCRYCGSTGILGGKLSGPRMGPFEVCPCFAGSEEIAEKVRAGNEAREKLLAQAEQQRFRTAVRTTRQFHGPHFHTPLETGTAGLERITRDANGIASGVVGASTDDSFSGAGQ